jgi:hypothetical protein
MRGYYVRLVEDSLPKVDQLIRAVGSQFYACHHQGMDGEIVVEIASARKWSPECVHIHVLEFFGEAMLEAGGIYVNDDGIRIPNPTRRNALWRRTMGKITFVLDDIDVSHPRALHATDYFTGVDPKAVHATN